MTFENYNGTLTKTGFIRGIEYLSTYYSTFKFWDETFKHQVELRKQLWYEAFKDYDDKTFYILVREYSKTNEFPPQSPTSLSEHAKKIIRNKISNPEEEYLRVKNIVNKNGYFNAGNKRQVKELGETTYKAFELTESLFNRAYHDTFNEPECRRNFIQVYKNEIERKIADNEQKLLTAIGHKETTRAKTMLGINDPDTEVASELTEITVRLLGELDPNSDAKEREAIMEGLQANRQFKNLSQELKDFIIKRIKTLTGQTYKQVVAIGTSPEA